MSYIDKKILEGFIFEAAEEDMLEGVKGSSGLSSSDSISNPGSSKKSKSISASSSENIGNFIVYKWSVGDNPKIVYVYPGIGARGTQRIVSNRIKKISASPNTVLVLAPNHNTPWRNFKLFGDKALEGKKPSSKRIVGWSGGARGLAGAIQSDDFDGVWYADPEPGPLIGKNHQSNTKMYYRASNWTGDNKRLGLMQREKLAPEIGAAAREIDSNHNQILDQSVKEALAETLIKNRFDIIVKKDMLEGASVASISSADSLSVSSSCSLGSEPSGLSGGSGTTSRAKRKAVREIRNLISDILDESISGTTGLDPRYTYDSGARSTSSPGSSATSSGVKSVESGSGAKDLKATENSSTHWNFSIDDGAPMDWNISNFSPEDLMSKGNRRVVMNKRAIRALDRAASRAGQYNHPSIQLTNQVSADRNGAYRDPKQNKKQGGAGNSRHMYGDAFDIWTQKWTKAERTGLLKNLFDVGFHAFGHGANNIHADMRPGSSIIQWPYSGYKVPDKKTFISERTDKEKEIISEMIKGTVGIDSFRDGAQRFEEEHDDMIARGEPLGSGADPLVAAYGDALKSLLPGLVITSNFRTRNDQARVSFQYPFAIDTLIRRVDSRIQPGDYFLSGQAKKGGRLNIVNAALKSIGKGSVTNGVYGGAKYRNIMNIYRKYEGHIQSVGRNAAPAGIIASVQREVAPLVGSGSPGSHLSGQALDLGGVSGSALKKAINTLKSSPRFSGYRIIGPKLEADHFHVGIIPASAAMS